MDSEHGRISSGNCNASLVHEKEDILATVNVNKHDLPKPKIQPKVMEETACSTSTSSSSSLGEDFFQIDTSELVKPMAVLDEIPRNNLQPPLLVENAQAEASLSFVSKHEMKDVGQDENMTAGSAWSGKVPIGTPLSSNDSNGIPGSDNFDTVGANQNAPIQSMYSSDVPDPHRIPSSIFARTKSTTPMEWSVASNESLFSIHMEKSGDLSSLYSSQFDGYPLMPPFLATSPAKSVGIGPGLHQTVDSETANAEAMKAVLKATTEKHAEKAKPPTVDGIRHSDSTSQFSDGGSVNSYRSFAFPILTAEGGRNGSCKGESVRQPSQKEQLQQPLPQTEPPKEEPPKAEPVAAQQNTWCSWFSCCSFCQS